MRIWIVNHYAQPPTSSGGPTRHLGLGRALAARGHDVVLHASVFDHYARADHRPRGTGPCTIEDDEGLKYVWWSTPPYADTRGRIVNMVRFSAAVSRRAGGMALPAPDVVIGSSPHLLAASAARRLARQFGVPFVFEVRDIWPQSLIDLGDFGSRHPAMVLLGRVERRLYRSADWILAVPPFASEHMVQHGADPSRISELPNGVDLDASPAPKPLKENDPFTIVYAGTLGHANGLEVAVDAAGELARRGRTDVRVRLVGAGPERQQLTARGRAALRSTLSIEPPVPSTAVPDLLAGSDACLLILRDSPVFRYGISPTKLFDYFAAGRPVVTSVRTRTDMVVDAGAGLRAEPGDPSSLADTIERLASMPLGERSAMGKRGRRYVEDHHAFSSLAARLEEVLERVVGVRSR